MANKRPLGGMTDSQVLRRLETTRNALREAECDLQDLLLELHDDTERWERLTYTQLAGALGVSRQAVQQRVARLLHLASARRAGSTGVDPNQLSLVDA